MEADKPLHSEKRLKVAQRIVEMSDQVLSTKNNRGYIALKVGTSSNSVAASVHEDRASFFIASSGLLEKARAEGFNPEEAPQTKLRNKHWYRFRGFGLKELQSHEDLFKEIVQESVRTVMDRRKKN